MKKVILTRHAKPHYGSSSNDHDLILSPEGVAEELSMIEELKQEGHHPTLIFHSPLTRTRQTAELIAEAFNCPLLPENALYEFDFERLTSLIDQNTGCLVFVGHAPSLREFFLRLTGATGVGLPFQPSSYRVVVIS